MKQIKLDLDFYIDIEYLDFFYKRYKDLNKLGLKISKIEVYDTRKGSHIYIEAEHQLLKSDYAICLIQLLFGSDWKREFFNIERLDANDGKTENWNILFCKKWHDDLKSWFSEQKNKNLEYEFKKIINKINKECDKNKQK